MPIVFHNFGNYDCHLIINDITQTIRGLINVLAKNSETYLNMKVKVPRTKIHLNFIDSYRFLSASLDTLTNYLPDDEKHILRQHCKNEEEFNYMKNKSFIPYEFIQNPEILQATEKLSQDKFYSRLKSCGISDENYELFSKMWDFFKCENLGQLLQIYLKGEVLLLTSIFERFRTECLSVYKLDPIFYISLGSFAWDAFLKMTTSSCMILIPRNQQNILFIWIVMPFILAR